MRNRKPGVPTSERAAPTCERDHSRARQRNGVSLEQVAEQTKISLRFLRAIEIEDFPQLPGGVFAANYIRQYAEASGLDAGDLLERYHQHLNPPAETAVPKRQPEQQRGFLDRLFRVPA